MWVSPEPHLWKNAHPWVVWSVVGFLQSPVWETPVAYVPKDSSGGLHCRFSISQLEDLEKKVLVRIPPSP